MCIRDRRKNRWPCPSLVSQLFLHHLAPSPYLIQGLERRIVINNCLRGYGVNALIGHTQDFLKGVFDGVMQATQTMPAISSSTRSMSASYPTSRIGCVSCFGPILFGSYVTVEFPKAKLTFALVTPPWSDSCFSRVSAHIVQVKPSNLKVMVVSAMTLTFITGRTRDDLNLSSGECRAFVARTV